MLEVDSINVSYGDIQVLWDVCFKAKPGEIVSIVGANGSGKTTLVRTISGVIHPKRGSISFMGTDITKLEPYKVIEKGIVQIPEGRLLFNDMTVVENLEQGAYSKEAKQKSKDSIKRMFEMFPRLEERKNQLAGTLSGGEQQMLAISRALMALPKCIMFDEPSLGLAPNLVDMILGIVKKLADQGLIVILVEQEIKKALKISSHGYVLENGRIVMEGTGIELLKNDEVKKAYLGF